MKRIIRLLVIILIMIVSIGCETKKAIDIIVNTELPSEFVIGTKDVDFSKYFWLTEDEKFITVTSDMIDISKVDFNKEGTYKVLFTYEGITKELEINIVSAVKPAPTINGAKDLLVGEELKLTVTITPEKELSYTFSSSDASVATVSNDGIVKALKTGKTDITVTLENGEKAQITINVTDKVTSLKSISLFNEDTKEAIKDSLKIQIGEIVSIGVKTDPTDATVDTTTFSSSDTTIATISATGKLEALNPGETIITVSVKNSKGEVKQTFVLTVSEQSTDPYIESLLKLSDTTKWNFVLKYKMEVPSEEYTYSDTYTYYGNSFQNIYESDNGNTYTDYIVYEDGKYYYYCEEDDGTYSIYDEESDEYYSFVMYTMSFDLASLAKFEYDEKDGYLYAKNPDEAAIASLGELEGSVCTSFAIKIENDELTSIICKSNVTDSETETTYEQIETITLSNHGKCILDLDELKKKTIKPLTSLNISGEKDLLVGERLTLVVTKNPADAVETITFTSSDELVATVDNKGVVTALGKGSVTITCIASNGVKATSKAIYISEENPVIETINITNPKDKMYVNDTYTIEYVTRPTNATPQDIIFSSSDESVLSVTNEGVVTANKVGTATITLTTSDEKVQTTIEITVREKEVIDYSKAFAKFTDVTKWNFVMEYKQEVVSQDYLYEESYVYYGENIQNTYVGLDGNTYHDYLIVKDNKYYYYSEELDGTYTVYDEDSDDFYELYMYLLMCNFNILNEYSYEAIDGILYATNPSQAAEGVLGLLEGATYYSFGVKIENDLVTSIVCKATYIDPETNLEIEQIETITFSNYDENTLDLDALDKKTIKPLTSLTITGEKDLIVNEVLQLVVTKDPISAIEELTFTSSDNSVATVNSDGVVTAINAGAVVITCTASNGVTIDSKKIYISLEGKVELIEAFITNPITKLYLNNTYTIIIEGKLSSASITKTEFKSSDETVLSVTNEGVVTALKEGTAIITVKLYTATNSVETQLTITSKEKEELNYEEGFNKLQDSNSNYIMDYELNIVKEEYYYSEKYTFFGTSLENIYEGEDGLTYTEYLIEENGQYYYYCENEDGTYTVYDSQSDEYFDFCSYLVMFNFEKLFEYEYDVVDGVLYALDPATVGSEMLGDYEGGTCTKLSFAFSDNLVSKITCETTFVDETTKEDIIYIETYTFSNYDSNTLDLASLKAKLNTDIPSGNTSTFIDSNLSVNAGELEYSSSRTSFGFDEIRGAQFTQELGVVEITSKQEVKDVSEVTLVVSTNQDAGMIVKVSVGETVFTCDENSECLIPKTAYNVNTTKTFVSATKASGIVKIILQPNAAKKSMYICSVTINSNGTDTPDPVKNYMPEQIFDHEKLSDKRLQDYVKDYDGAIGIQSTGDYHVLVIPVKFTDTTISTADIDKINKAFNGTEADTGWESVTSFYYESSYGKLKLAFDITTVYNAKNTRKYYESYQKQLVWEEGETTYQTGDTLLLLEALGYFEPTIDLSIYDNDKDGVIDGIYLLYSGEIDYNEESDFFWAYVTTYSAPEKDNKTFDGLDAYYYLFAGINFVNEDTKNGFEYNGRIDSLLINASTYIHETGHMLMLDDYYDYDTKAGCNLGLGGADMMDSTIGDHSSYSKIMLGWIEPEVVTETKTITISSFEETGDTIMILLDYNDSYMCEYLLIDLYTNDGLNALHAGINYLYGDEKSGVRIYHVSSYATNPYSTEYYSFTDYNNTDTDKCLIRLIEADGEKNYKSSDGYVSANDLWQAGDTFSSVYSSYTRNDGKLINFDITIDSLTSDEAVITITFIK